MNHVTKPVLSTIFFVHSNFHAFARPSFWLLAWYSRLLSPERVPGRLASSPPHVWLAAWSALSLSLIPLWPGIHSKVTLFPFASCLSSSLHSHTKIEEISGLPTALIPAWLSEQIVMHSPTFSSSLCNVVFYLGLGPTIYSSGRFSRTRIGF